MEPIAIVERNVSASAWIRFPALLEALKRWADNAGPDGAGFVVSAVPMEQDCISVRVTRTGDDGRPIDFLEWVAPLALVGAEPSAIDHLAARETHALSLRLLMDTSGPTKPRPLPGPPSAGREPMPDGTQKEGEKTMARTRKTAEPEPITPAKSRPGRKPAARAEPAATAPRAETRGASRPAPAKAPAAAPAKPAATRTSKAAPAAKPGKAAPAAKPGKAAPAAKPGKAAPAAKRGGAAPAAKSGRK